jgi:hypothetical protein
MQVRNSQRHHLTNYRQEQCSSGHIIQLDGNEIGACSSSKKWSSLPLARIVQSQRPDDISSVRSEPLSSLHWGCLAESTRVQEGLVLMQRKAKAKAKHSL